MLDEAMSLMLDVISCGHNVGPRQPVISSEILIYYPWVISSHCGQTPVNYQDVIVIYERPVHTSHITSTDIIFRNIHKFEFC